MNNSADAAPQLSLWQGRHVPSHQSYNFSRGRLIVSGRGLQVKDKNGRWYLDMRSSAWNMTLGHNNPFVTKRIRQQLRRLVFSQAGWYDPPPAVVVEYAEALVAKLPTGMRHVRLGCTSSQMIDAAILLSRRIRRLLGQPSRTGTICLDGAYHGTGCGPSALAGDDEARKAFGPILPDVRHVPRPFCYRCPLQLEYPACSIHCAAELEKTVMNVGADRVSAVVIEPIMARSMVIPPPGYLERVARFCREHDIHLIVDETTTGFGRVGAYTRVEQLGLVPDMLVLGKGLAAGHGALAALAVHDRVFQEVRDEVVYLGSTSDGHPLAVAAGAAVIDFIDSMGLLDHVCSIGNRIVKLLIALRESCDVITDVRGQGLMIGVELCDPTDGTPWSAQLMEHLRLTCEERGVLISTQSNCVTLLPPLIIDDAAVDVFLDVLADSLRAVKAVEPVRARHRDG